MFHKMGLFGMIGFVAVCLFILAGLGLYFNWLGISTSSTNKDASDVHLTLNKPVIKADVKAVQEGVQHGEKVIVDKVHRLFGEKTIQGPIHQIAVAQQELTIRDKEKHDVTIKVVATTSIKINDKDSSFSDLKAEDPVSIQYEANKDGNVAKTVTVQKVS